MNAGSAVEKDVVIEQNAALVRSHESSDRIECQSFSGSACSEQDRDSGGGFELEIEREPRGVGACGKRGSKARLNHRGLKRFASAKIDSATTDITSTRVRASAPL